MSTRSGNFGKFKHVGLKCILPKWAANRVLKSIIVLVVFGFLYYCKYGPDNLYKAVQKVERKTLTTTKFKSTTNLYISRKLILLWNIPSTVSHPSWLDKRCGNCEITEDRSLMTQSDAIVIHYRNTGILPLKDTRTREQVYVWLCKESPRNIKKKFNLGLFFEDHYFNATMTHRRNSDIFIPYFKNVNEYPPKIAVLDKNITNLVNEKSKVAIWIVSHCKNDKGSTYRYNYVEDVIKAGLEVDRFGKCFPENHIPKYKTKESFEVLRKYKFYFAFENTLHCRDYVTEKFWVNAIYSGVVPVVWGPTKKDIIELAPPNSFIFAEDFETPAKLAAYLHNLNNNTEAYLKYFDWRDILVRSPNSLSPKSDNHDSTTTQLYGYCALCNRLRSKKGYSNVPSLEKWWYDFENKNECLE